jgi:EmrB/QacA subfamily drug resistance transporter
MGLYGVGVVVAPGVGPILGGYFVEYLSWPWIYWVNVPIGVVATLAALFVLKEQPLVRGKKLDVLGFACIATGLFAFLLALEKGTTWGWTSYSVLGLLALAVNLILLWLVIAQQRENPLLDISVFRNGNFVKSMALIGVLMVGLFAMLFYLPQFLQSVQGYTPFNTGVLVLPQAIMLITIIPVAGQLYDKIGARWPAVIGLTLVGAGLLLLSRINTDIPKWDLIIAQAVVGAGVGVALMPIMTGALAELTLEQRDSGSALNTLIQRVSQSFGIALITGMMTVNHRQIFADQSSLTYAQGVDVTPELERMVQQGPGGLLSLWQNYGNSATTIGYSQAFTITGSLALAAVLVAFLLPTGRPAAAEGERPAMH